TRRDIERQQADNIPSLLQTLPGVTMGGSPKPGGQTTNIWGLGDAEDVPYTLDGAQKSGFERYQQGTVFGRSEDRRVDALLYLNGRDGRDMKLADNLPLSPTDYPINPKRLPNSAQ
ncbi:Plug domain-containing protein, partial [Escherichia coli]|uniref:Plug domain-containing protein n=1 Tax=Escherichia coli TaxID=562 RepID=UPI000FF84400